MNVEKKGFLFVSLFSFTWALNVILAAYTIVSLEVNAYVYGMQTLLGAAVLFLVYIGYMQYNGKKFKLYLPHLAILLFMGILSNGIGNYFALKGLVHSPTNYAFLIKTSVFFTFITEVILGQEKFDYKLFLLMLLFIVGALFISLDKNTLSFNHYDLYSIIAAACVGFVGAWSKDYVQQNASEWMAFFRCLGGGITLLFLAIYLDHTLGSLLHIEYGLLGGLLVFLLFYFLYKLLEFKSASYASMLSMMFSIMVIGLEYFIFGKTPNTMQLIGAGIIILGVITTEWYNQQKKTK